MEAQKLRAKARAKQASTRQKKKTEEAFDDLLPNIRRELAPRLSNPTAAVGAAPVIDSDFVREKQQAGIDLQKTRLAKVEEKKSMQAIETRKLLAEEIQGARDEYTRLRAELPTERAGAEPDEVYTHTLERDPTMVLKGLRRAERRWMVTVLFLGVATLCTRPMQLLLCVESPWLLAGFLLLVKLSDVGGVGGARATRKMHEG